MSALSNVLHLKRYRKNRLTPDSGSQLPEPAALYALIILTFVTHAPYVNMDTCVQCNTAWPCELARRAYRLREGF